MLSSTTEKNGHVGHEDSKDSPERSSGTPVTRFFRKYFWEGQKLSEGQAKAMKTIPPDAV